MTASLSRRSPIERSPRAMARLAGVLLLLTMVLGGVGQSLQGHLLLAGDPTGTARQVEEQGGRLWLAFAAYLVELSCQVGFTVVVYELLRPVSRTGSALAACFGFLGIVVKVVGRCCLIFPTLALGNANHLTALATDQRELLAYLALGMNVYIAGVATIFFGLSAMIAGYLILRSTFLPAFLGVLGIIAGAGWLAFIHPPFGLRWSLYVVALGVLGALVKVLWFTIFGVREGEWRETARRAVGLLWT